MVSVGERCGVRLPSHQRKRILLKVCSSQGVEPRNFPHWKLPPESSRNNGSRIALHVDDSRRAKDPKCLRPVSLSCRLKPRFIRRAHTIYGLPISAFFFGSPSFPAAEAAAATTYMHNIITLLKTYSFKSGGLFWRAMWGSTPQPPAKNIYQTYAVARESNPVTFPVGSYH